MIKVTFTDGSAVEYPTAVNNCPSLGEGHQMHLIEKLEDGTLTDVAILDSADIDKLEVL
jgi:hypothetical protein